MCAFTLQKAIWNLWVEEVVKFRLIYVNFFLQELVFVNFWRKCFTFQFSEDTMKDFLLFSVAMFVDLYIV